MYSFEGDFRRRPQQNLGGASLDRKTDRDSIIHQSHLQRIKREEYRKQLNSTITVQAWAKSYLTRKHCKQAQREIFDSCFPTQDIIEDVHFNNLLTKLLFFYNLDQDLNRLITTSQIILKHWRRVIQNDIFTLQIRRLLGIHLGLLKKENILVSLAIPLRMLEMFTSVSNYEQYMKTEDAMQAVGKHTLYLVQKGYFNELRYLLDNKTPPLFGMTSQPPTLTCSSLIDLVQRPLLLTSRVNVPDFDNTIMTEFSISFLSTPFSEAVDMFVLPFMYCDPKSRFPYLALINSLCDSNNYDDGRLTHSSWLLYSVLVLEPRVFVNQIRTINNAKLPSNPLILNYLRLMAKLSRNLTKKQAKYEFEDSLSNREPSDNFDEDSDSDKDIPPMTLKECTLLNRCIDALNEPGSCIMAACSQIAEGDLCDDFLESMSGICHNMLLSHKLALHNYRLLYTLAFKPVFVRSLWRWLSSLNHVSSFGGMSLSLLGAISRGMGADATMIGIDRILPPLAVFCALFSLLIGTLHDSEFRKDDIEEQIASATSEPISKNRLHAFKFSELGNLCRTLRLICFGLVEFAYPDSRSRILVPSTGYNPEKELQLKLNPAWPHLFKVCSHLVRALYVRSARLHFCPESDWAVTGAIPEGPLAISAVLRHQQHSQPKRNVVDHGPPLTSKELRTVMILREIPFIVSFASRVQIFQGVLLREKHDHFYELSSFNEGPSINISVRRTHLYEDAFDKLSYDNEPDLKLKLRVQLINQAGVEEAGVDGGGLFREFLSELLKSAFDPNRGLFKLTKDNMLYPNPGVHLLYEDFPLHYYFVGRILGKAIYENLLVELPLAEFFLEKQCSSRESDVHSLASLDPALYRGLLMLRAHRRQDVPELGLDFTMLSDDLGEQRIEELKPGGANIPVTAENRIEYIHLVADYKLNRQIRLQVSAFKRGLTSVISEEWLRMFSSRELQLLISGDEVAIDVEDLKHNTQYSGVFTVNHHTIQNFWKAVENFTDDQRRALLKFVTSCSRPPLLGFRELQPPFCIQSAGVDDRLPSASTCMNLLKLPEFPNLEVLTERLLYAINAGAGFELS